MGEPGSRQTTYPSSRSPWPVRPLVPLATEKSAPSSRGRCPSGVARVLSTATRSRVGVRRVREAPYVAYVEPGVGRGLDPQQPGSVEDRELGVGAGRGGAHADPVRLQLLPQQGQRLVAVVGQDHGVAGARLGEEDGGDRRHAGGEDDGLHFLAGGLQFPDRPLQQGPGGVGVAAVGVRAFDVAREVEVGGEDRSGQGRLVLHGLRQSGADGAGAVAGRLGCSFGGVLVHAVCSFRASRTASSRPGLAASTSSRHSSNPSRDP